VQVANNVVYNVSADGLVMTEGPAAGEPPDTFNNNIIAYARKAMFEEQNSWPQNCTNQLRANITHNLFYFDLDKKTGFYPVTGCTDSCGMAYNQYQNFQGNLYWRTDGGFGSDSNAFFVLSNPPPPNQASTCGQIPNPTYDTLTFAQWQNGSPLVNGKSLQMKEDLTGTASVNPGFGDSGQPTDFLLSSSPVSGFDYSATDDTINNAGRNNPLLTAPTVPETLPTYAYPSF
jgi:hypothetical protein